MRLPIVFLLMTVLIDSMGIGLIIPVMPDLLKEVSGEGLSGAALWGGVLSSLFAVMQFLCAPLLGTLSDAYGRRPVLFGTLGIIVVHYVVMGLTQSLVLLIVARMVGGMASATQSTAAAAMADLSEPGKRAQGFGLVGAAFGLGFVLGPLLGGLLGEFGTRAPFWAAAGLAMLNLILGLIVFPETTRPETRRPLRLSEANPFGAFKALSRLPGITRGLAIVFLYNTAFAVYPAVWSFFGLARFGWSTGMIGLSLGLFGVSMALVQGLLIRSLIKRLGEPGCVLFGLGFAATAFLAIPLVPNGAVVLLLTPLAALGGAFAPALTAMMSNSLTPGRQGALQGVLTSAAAIAMVISPMLMTWTFAAFTAPEGPVFFPGAPFLLSLALVSVALTLFLTRPRETAVA